MTETFREGLEERLLTLPNVRPIDESAEGTITAAKDGTFGLSYLGFLLYCHGRNERGLSRKRPNGLLYSDGETTFGIGIFRRETETHGGHLLISAPRGPDANKTVDAFLHQVRAAAPEFKSNAYVRFLKTEAYCGFLKQGFRPVQENPWHPHAHAEDETFHHSSVELGSICKEAGFEAPPRIRRLRDNHHRFGNFLKRNAIELEPAPFNAIDAKSIIHDHFRDLQHKAKRVGSTAEDYYALLEADLTRPSCFSLMLSARRRQERWPVSVFVGEKTTPDTMALYCSITRRKPETWQQRLALTPDSMTGFSALGTYVFWQAFGQLKKRFPEVTRVQLGGSETAELDAFKRRMGAIAEPTYWVIRPL